MTKWARMRRRKERKRMEQKSTNSVSEGNKIKPTEPEKIPDKIKYSEKTQKLEIPKTSKSNPILSQIPRYVYLGAFFALLSGVFFPMVTPGTEASAKYVIGGIVTLFIGLAGCILLFKATSSYNKRGIFLIVGFVLLAISLVLIFLMQYLFREEFNV